MQRGKRLDHSASPALFIVGSRHDASGDQKTPVPAVCGTGGYILFMIIPHKTGMAL